MTLMVKDKHVITFLRQTTGYSTKQLLKMFPEKQWTLGGLNHFIRKIDIIGDIHRKPGSGRPRCARTDDVIDQAEDLESGGRPAVPLLTEADRKTSKNIFHVCQQNH